MDLDVYGLNEADQIRSLVDPSGTYNHPSV